MKRLLFSLYLISILTLAVFSQTARIISENANLRGTASQSGHVVTTLANDTELIVIKQVGPWFLVQAPEYVGWVHGNTIRLSTNRSSKSTALAASPTYTTVTPSYPVEEQKIDTPPVTAAPAVRERTVTAPTEGEATSPTATAICSDGTYSYSLNHSGTCSHHGGVSSWLDGSVTPSPSTDTNTSSDGGTVNVKGYYRKDGTYVRPYTRSAPHSKKP